MLGIANSLQPYDYVASILQNIFMHVYATCSGLSSVVIILDMVTFLKAQENKRPKHIHHKETYSYKVKC